MSSRIKYNNPNPTGTLTLPYHYEMVSDTKRVMPFKEAIQLSCRGKRVLESGTGSGILSILAAQAGATHVYATEIDSHIASFAKKNFKQSGYQQNISLIQKDTHSVTLEDIDNKPVDVVIAENLSTWQVTEPHISIMNYVNKHLIRHDGIRIPQSITNYIELTRSPYRFQNVVDLKTHYFEFSGITRPYILSNKIIFSTLDLTQQNAPIVNKKITIQASKNGTANGLRLTSPLCVYKKITFDTSDSLMPPVIVPLSEDIQVKTGDVVEICIQFVHNTNWNLFTCTASKITHNRPLHN